MYLHVLRREERVGIESLSGPERALICTVLLEAEVNNGGFDQYFFNSSGDWAKYTTVALADIGAWHTAGLFQRAINGFPGGKPSEERHRRWEELDQVDQTVLSQLDQEFYKEHDNLTELLSAHIRANAQMFSGGEQ